MNAWNKNPLFLGWCDYCGDPITAPAAIFERRVVHPKCKEELTWLKAPIKTTLKVKEETYA